MLDRAEGAIPEGVAMSIKKALMVAGLVILVLKFRNQLLGVTSKIPVVGPFVA